MNSPTPRQTTQGVPSDQVPYFRWELVYRLHYALVIEFAVTATNEVSALAEAQAQLARVLQPAELARIQLERLTRGEQLAQRPPLPLPSELDDKR